MAKKSKRDTDPVLQHLSDIRRLLVLALLRNGATQEEIAVALDISQSSVSKMFPQGIRAVVRSRRNARGGTNGSSGF